jgi:hypothetical protein
MRDATNLLSMWSVKWRHSHNNFAWNFGFNQLEWRHQIGVCANQVTGIELILKRVRDHMDRDVYVCFLFFWVRPA